MSEREAMVLDAQGKPSRRFTPKEFVLEELTGQPVPKPGDKKDALDEEGGFRLLVHRGKHEDPQERAQREADRLTSEAEAKSKSLVEEAQSQADGIRQDAYQKGYDQGRQEGIAASKAMVTAAADNLARTVKALEKARAEFMTGLEGEMVGLVQAVCERVFMTPDAVPPAVIQNLVRQAVGRLLDFEKVTVKLSAKDMAAIEEYRPELLKQFSELGRLSLITEEGIRPGECLVETPTCKVDASLDTRRQRVFEALTGAMETGEPLDWSAAITAAANADPQAGLPPAQAGAPAEETPAARAEADEPEAQAVPSTEEEPW